MSEFNDSYTEDKSLPFGRDQNRDMLISLGYGVDMWAWVHRKTNAIIYCPPHFDLNASYAPADKPA